MENVFHSKLNIRSKKSKYEIGNLKKIKGVKKFQELQIVEEKRKGI